jgi:predicted ferric reductase
MSTKNLEGNAKSLSNRQSILTVFTVTAFLFGIFWAYIYHKQSLNKSPAALAMPSMHMDNMSKYWSFPVLQASGLAGILTAYFAILLGTHQSSKTKKWLGLNYQAIDKLHRHFSIATVVLVLVHAYATLMDAMGDSWKTVFFFNGWANPKTGWPAAVWGYNLGVFGLYAILILAPTFYLRRKIGVQIWKFVHRFIVLFYVASLWHTLILGVELGYYKWLRPLVWLLQLPVLYYLGNRFREHAEKNQSNKSGIRYLTAKLLQAIFWLSIIAVLLIVLTGNSDFIKNNFTGL